MIRKLVVLIALLLPTIVVAAPADRDILLTPRGVLYTIDSLAPQAIEVDSPSTRVLQLTARDGANVSKYLVPSTLTGAAHVKPTLAYDLESNTLFVFWQKSPNALSSELLFASFHDGVWSEATSIDRSSYNIRFNLKIASTPYATYLPEEGAQERRKALSIHAIWWEQTGYGEEARYAMLSLDKGKVTRIDLRRLIDYTSGNRTEIPAEVDEDFDRSFFRNPAIFQSSENDRVDVVFADWERNRLHRISIRPIISYGVIRVPDGVWRGEIGAPRGPVAFGNVSAILGTSDDSVTFYSESDTEVRYLIHKDGAWSPVRSLPLSSELTSSAAIGALKRLATSE
jgi:hypothetical protein